MATSAIMLLAVVGASALRAPAARTAPPAVARQEFLGGAAFALVGAAAPAVASVSEPTQSNVGSNVAKDVGRRLLQIERLNVDSNISGDRTSHVPRLTISGNSATVTCYHEVRGDRDFVQSLSPASR